ncbi:MAG: hypothetical protein ACYTDY_06080 [Planctomycetota bacterium]
MTYTCPLCNFSFGGAEMAESSCATCASSPRSCGLVKCPACGNEWPAESDSKVVGLLKKLLGGGSGDR